MRKEKQSPKSSISARDADSSASAKGCDDKEASCSLVGVMEPTVSLAPEAGEDLQAMAGAVQANLSVVLLDSSCSHHLMGTREVFVDLQPSGGVKHVRDFNGALQDFLLLKDYKTRYVWERPVAKKSHVLQVFVQWLAMAEWQTKKSVLMLRSDRGGEVLGKEFTAFVDGKGIVHNLTCPYTLQQNGMAEREMRTMVDLVRTMLLHMGVQHHWWHLAFRQAIWIRNCLERSALPPGTTPFQVLTEKKPDLSLARVWGCWAQFLVPAQQRGGKLKPKARPTRRRTPATLPLLAEVGEPAAEDVENVPSSSPAPPLVADLRGLTPVSAFGDEGSSVTSPMTPTECIAGGRRDVVEVGVGMKSSPTREEQAVEVQPKLEKTGERAAAKPTKGQSAIGQSAGEPTALEKSAGMPTTMQQDTEGSDGGDNGGDAEESTDSDVVEVQTGPRESGRIRRPPDFYVPAAFTTAYNGVDDDLLYDNAGDDEELSELDPDMHADLEHRWDISTMTVKEALASWKGKAVKAAMAEEIRSLIGMGTWELVERPPGVNVMKNRWVLTTK
ncbi:unnamed protein product [Closterium sp. Naga37s-1]|nr:unnamed protein product [Closterium sp. Naga37s-1]